MIINDSGFNIPVEWIKWGLYSCGLPPWAHLDEVQHVSRCHWMVINYLRSHPEISNRWRHIKQKSEHKPDDLQYFDILRLAENKLGYCHWYNKDVI